MNPFVGAGFENIAVWSLVKIAGQLQEEEWTGKEKITFCRDKRSKRVDEIVIVISNSTWIPGAADVVAPRPPRVIATNIGCWQWRGSATWRFERHGVDDGHPFESWMTATSEVTFERTDEILGDLQEEVYRPVAGNVSWSCGGINGRGCSDPILSPAAGGHEYASSTTSVATPPANMRPSVPPAIIRNGPRPRTRAIAIFIAVLERTPTAMARAAT